MKKGFTLVELLAVIVILAIIALIAVPMILGVITTAKKGAAESSTLGYIDAVEKSIVISNLVNNELISEGTYDVTTLNSNVKVKGTKPTSGNVTINSKGEVSSAVLGINNFRVNYSYGKARVDIDNDVNTITSLTGLPNVPMLADNMIAVTYNETTDKWIKADINTNWYNYATFKWANAVTVKINGTKTRNYYVNAAIGTEININDINTMWVWIPRYEYKFTSTSLSEIQVNFLSNKTTTPTTGYIVHPAFDFGGNQLTGFWAAKFEASGTIDNLTVIPNVNSLANLNISTMFNATRNMDLTYSLNYGFDKELIDTHMMKNMEWGAIAYLSNSKYGKYSNPSYTGLNKEIYINNYYDLSTITTVAGCSSGGPSTAVNNTSCSYTYNVTDFGTGASTTGTIYGIYDMNGGKHEYIMANMKDATGNFSFSSSGFTSVPESKYYDSYAYSASIYTDYSERGLIGDATKETINWNSDNAALPYNSASYLCRGGSTGGKINVGIFNFIIGKGQANNFVSFRPTLIIE